MTVRGFIEKHICDRGLFEKDAKVVMDAVIAKPEMKEMEGRWNDIQDAHPKVLYATLLISVYREVIAWMDRERPNHFARPMFQLVEENRQ